MTPDIDGTVVHVRHDVDGVLVYVRSDDDLRAIAAYAASDLLHVVTPAYNEWAALLTFVRQHTTCRSADAHAHSRRLWLAWLAWHTHARAARQMHMLYMHVARRTCAYLLRTTLHSWRRHHRRRVHTAEVSLTIDARQLHSTLVAWSRHVISCRTHTLRTLRRAWRILRGLHSVPPPLCLRTQDSAASVDVDSRFNTAALIAGGHSGRIDLTFDRAAFEARHPLASATGSMVLAAQQPDTQIGASDMARARTAGSKIMLVGGCWLGSDTPRSLPQPLLSVRDSTASAHGCDGTQDDAGVTGSSAPAAPHADKTHVHAVTARAAADAAATALLNPTYMRMRDDLYELGITDASHCNAQLLAWQHRDDAFGRYAALHVTAYQLHCVVLAAEIAAKLIVDHSRSPSTPAARTLQDDALSACKTATRGATTSASPARSPLAQPSF